MAIISISRGSNSHGREIARLIAERLGYDCVARKVLLEASEEFNIPEFKLERELHDAPGLFDRFSRRKERYISYVKTALLDHVQKDNVVYHGLAGHVFLKGVSHVLRVRIIANLEDRIQEEMLHESISYGAARQRLVKDDEERRKWSQFLYGIDSQDPENYDLCIHINQLSIEEAVQMIVRTAQLPRFQATAESQMHLDAALLQSRIESRLLGTYDVVDLDTRDGDVFVQLDAPFIMHEKLSEEVSGQLCDISPVGSIHVDVQPTGFEF